MNYEGTQKCVLAGPATKSEYHIPTNNFKGQKIPSIFNQLLSIPSGKS
jgi:hypothetical protein